MKKLRAIVTAMPAILTLGGCASVEDAKLTYYVIDDPELIPRLIMQIQEQMENQGKPYEQKKQEQESPPPEIMANFYFRSPGKKIDEDSSRYLSNVSTRNMRCDDLINKISQDSEFQTVKASQLQASQAAPQWTEDQAKEYAFRLLGNDLHGSIGAVVDFAYDTRRELRKIGRFELGNIKGKVRVSGGISGLDDMGLRLEYKLGKDSKLFLEWMHEAGSESITDDVGDDGSIQLLTLSHPKYGSQTWKATDFTESYLLFGYEIKFR